MLTKMARARLLAGLLILLDVRGSFTWWFFPGFFQASSLLMAKILRHDEG
jgi:hypothetical protein